MRVKLRKLLKRRRRFAEKPRADETVSKLLPQRGKAIEPKAGGASCAAFFAAYPGYRSHKKTYPERVVYKKISNATPSGLILIWHLSQGWLQKTQPTLGFATLPLWGSFETASPLIPGYCLLSLRDKEV